MLGLNVSYCCGGGLYFQKRAKYQVAKLKEIRNDFPYGSNSSNPNPGSAADVKGIISYLSHFFHGEAIQLV